MPFRAPRADLFKLSEFEEPHRWLDEVPRVTGVSWKTGKPIAAAVPKPLRFTLQSMRPDTSDELHDKSDHGPIVPDFMDNPRVPLASHAFVEALHSARVDNVQTFDAVLIDPDKGAELRTHVAVNIVGVVRNEKFSVEENDVGTLRLFRLDPYEIAVVDDSLRKALLKAGIATLRFRSMRGCAGLGD